MDTTNNDRILVVVTYGKYFRMYYRVKQTTKIMKLKRMAGIHTDMPLEGFFLTHNDIAIADDEHLTVGDVGLQDLAKIVAVGIGRYEAKKTEKAEHAPVDQTGLAACFELLDL